MKSHLVQARIDERTARLLARLKRRSGVSESELVRRGLELLAETPPAKAKRRIHGLGQFSSGQHDLGSNKRHLAGFGKK